MAGSALGVVKVNIHGSLPYEYANICLDSNHSTSGRHGTLRCPLICASAILQTL